MTLPLIGLGFFAVTAATPFLGRFFGGLLLLLQLLLRTPLLLRFDPSTEPIMRLGLMYAEDAASPGATESALKALRRLADGYDQRMLVGEVYLMDPAKVATYYGHGDELHRTRPARRGRVDTRFGQRR